MIIKGIHAQRDIISINHEIRFVCRVNFFQSFINYKLLMPDFTFAKKSVEDAIIPADSHSVMILYRKVLLMNTLPGRISCFALRQSASMEPAKDRRRRHRILTDHYSTSCPNLRSIVYVFQT